MVEIWHIFVGCGQPNDGKLAAGSERFVKATDYDALVSHIATHDADCQALCGIGEAEAVACGYRPYFLNNGRRCPTCPVHDQIGFPDDRAGVE